MKYKSLLQELYDRSHELDPTTRIPIGFKQYPYKYSIDTPVYFYIDGHTAKGSLNRGRIEWLADDRTIYTTDISNFNGHLISKNSKPEVGSIEDYERSNYER